MSTTTGQLFQDGMTSVRGFFRDAFKSWIAHHQRMVDAGLFSID